MLKAKKYLKTKAFISAMLVIAITALPLCGCEHHISESSDEKSLTDHDDSLLRISVCAENEPLEYTDDSGDILGFDAALGMLIAEKLGKHAVFMNTKNDLVISSVSSGITDIALSSVENNDENKKLADLSDTYITLTTSAVAHSDNEQRFKNFSDAEVGVVYGSASQSCAENELGLLNVAEYRNQGELTAALLRGDIEVMLCDSYAAAAFVAEYTEFVILYDDLGEIKYSAAAAKDNSEFLSQINDIISEFASDGTLMDLRRAYINGNEELRAEFNSRLKAY